MKSKLMAIVAVLFLISCGSGKSSKETTEEKEVVEIEVNEDAIVDSISTSVDQIKEELSKETEEATEEIDELLKDI